MKQEDKQLLLKDLCGRLPYNVICSTVFGDCAVLYVDMHEGTIYIPCNEWVYDFKPFLRRNRTPECINAAKCLFQRFQSKPPNGARSLRVGTRQRHEKYRLRYSLNSLRECLRKGNITFVRTTRKFLCRVELSIVCNKFIHQNDTRPRLSQKAFKDRLTWRCSRFVALCNLSIPICTQKLRVGPIVSLSRGYPSSWADWVRAHCHLLPLPLLSAHH